MDPCPHHWNPNASHRPGCPTTGATGANTAKLEVPFQNRTLVLRTHETCSMPVTTAHKYMFPKPRSSVPLRPELVAWDGNGWMWRVFRPAIDDASEKSRVGGGLSALSIGLAGFGTLPTPFPAQLCRYLSFSGDQRDQRLRTGPAARSQQK